MRTAISDNIESNYYEIRGINIMSKLTRRLADGIINVEFEHVEDKNLNDMNDLEEYKELAKRCDKIHHILLENTPIELHDLINEMLDKQLDQLCYEIRYYFKEGVKCGLTRLKFLEEIGDEIAIV